MEAVIFDLDETLLDRTGSLKMFCRWQAEHQCGLDEIRAGHFVNRFLEMDENGANGKDTMYQALVREFANLGAGADDLLAAYVTEFARYCAPKAGAPEAVEELYGMGYRLAIVSNGKSPFQEKNFSALNLSKYFDEIVVSDAVGCKKPEKRIFSIVCSRLGVSPGNCVFVGDNPIADMQGASSAGMYTVYVPGYYGASCKEADAICTDYKELPDIVKNAS